MDVYSSFSNDSNLNSSVFCLHIHPFSIIFPATFFTISIFLFPFFIFILHHGLQQWRKTSSSSSMSHSDCFTYHMVLMELIGIIGYVVFFCGRLYVRGYYVGKFSWTGKLGLHLLTSMERYLAVVHPITYMRLKNRTGIRIRNVSIVCVWMFSGAFIPTPPVFGLYILTITTAAVLLFSLSVLLVLVRPGPGEQGGNRQWADPSKKRAFFTIVAILGVLVLKFSGDFSYGIVHGHVQCVLEAYLKWLELPNSLVLPLLFVLRHGRRNGSKR